MADIKCPKCGELVTTSCYKNTTSYLPVNKLHRAAVYKVPFYCKECGAIKFKYRAINDYVFIWPIPLEKTFKKNGLIVRPDDSIDPTDELHGRSDYGIVLSVGRGYYDNKRFHSTEMLKVGMKVIYDKKVLYPTLIEIDTDGNRQVIVTCGYLDVKIIV